MVLKVGTNLLQVKRLDGLLKFIFKHYRMRIPHGYTDKPIALSLYLQLFEQFRSLNRFSHIHGDSRDFPILHLHIKIFNPGCRLHADTGLIHYFVIIGIFSHAAHSVAAHCASGAVQIIHIHLTVGHFRRFDKNQAV